MDELWNWIVKIFPVPFYYSDEMKAEFVQISTASFVAGVLIGGGLRKFLKKWVKRHGMKISVASVLLMFVSLIGFLYVKNRPEMYIWHEIAAGCGFFFLSLLLGMGVGKKLFTSKD